MGLVGGLMTFRHHLRGADNPYLRDTWEADQPGFGSINRFEAHVEAPKRDATALNLGILFIVAGTIIWGYGDLWLTSLKLCDR